MSETQSTRFCTKCRVAKSLEEFHKNKSKASGFNSHCRSCREVRKTISRPAMEYAKISDFCGDIQIRHIPSYPGYWASSDGRIWSQRHSMGFQHRLHRIHPIEYRDHKSTVVYVNLYKDGKARPRRVGCFVLEAFVGPGFPGAECRHLNDDPWDNSLDNLAWGTRKDNALDASRNNRFPIGIKHWKAKLTAEDVSCIRTKYNAVDTEGRVCSRKRGIVVRELAQKYNVNIATIKRIAVGKSRRHLIYE